MKQATLKSNSEILHKIESIEKEVTDLKFSVLKKLSPSKKNIVTLKGVLKGIKITDKEIEQAKKSLYSKIEI